jgi:glutamate N-acetyltransferase/amino-acid N-acetyltransferase
MIHPNMATMLGFVATDIAIPPQHLHEITQRAVHRSFNAISVDGDTSTNDTFVIMANGLSGTSVSGQVGDEDTIAFEANVTQFCQELAKMIVRDGEGATKFITVRVLVSMLV